MAEDRPTMWADVAGLLSQLQVHHAAGEMTDEIQAIRAIATMPLDEFMRIVGKAPEMTPVTYTEAGGYEDAWAYPVRLEEASAILERVREISRGETPAEDQKQWGFTFAVGVQAIKKGQEEAGADAQLLEVVMPEINDAPLLWGDLGELLHFFACIRQREEVQNIQCLAMGDYLRRIIWNLVLDIQRVAPPPPTSEPEPEPEPGGPPEVQPAPPPPPTEGPTAEIMPEPTVETPPPAPATGATDELRARVAEQAASDDATRERIEQRTGESLAAVVSEVAEGTVPGEPPPPEQPAAPPIGTPAETPPEPAAGASPPAPPPGPPGGIPLEEALKEPPGPKPKPEPEITDLKTDARPGQPCRIVLKIEIPQGAQIAISVAHT